MSATNVMDAIVEGLAETYHEESDTWTPNLTGQAAREAAIFHDNASLRLADESVWLVTRRVMDPTLGEHGDVRFAIKAATGAEAGRVADEFCGAINEFYKSNSPSKWAVNVRREATEAIL